MSFITLWRDSRGGFDKRQWPLSSSCHPTIVFALTRNLLSSLGLDLYNACGCDAVAPSLLIRRQSEYFDCVFHVVMRRPITPSFSEARHTLSFLSLDRFFLSFFLRDHKCQLVGGARRADSCTANYSVDRSCSILRMFRKLTTYWRRGYARTGMSYLVEVLAVHAFLWDLWGLPRQNFTTLLKTSFSSAYEVGREKK